MLHDMYFCLVSHPSARSSRSKGYDGLFLDQQMKLLEELGATNIKPNTLHYDNQYVIILLWILFLQQDKHIEIDSHFRIDKVLQGLL